MTPWEAYEAERRRRWARNETEILKAVLAFGAGYFLLGPIVKFLLF